MSRQYTTDATITWCPGCGNFGIKTAYGQAVDKLAGRGVPTERLVMTAGIGQHAKMFDYVTTSGFYSLHGRALATAQGIKIGNPELKVVSFVGDGDSLGEGIAHFVFAAKRNSDITVICHNNGVYALTTGQRAPTSPRGFKGPSTPHGNVEEPLNPLVVALESGATFVARGYSGKLEQLADLIVEGVLHEGFAYIDVLQPCVTFNNLFDHYNENTYDLEEPADSFGAALEVARETEKLATGIIYRRKAPSHEAALLGQRVPARDRPTKAARREQVAGLLKSMEIA
ncbi:MAG: 2-oxoacid:ferredoxin oxidoreductase subunit beta [Candidatus Eisenbacteria bacterium]|nr:2-oxoacid:ferredoxin oxidoreductase subunit beta [Candidatus Eisenbacteria bacterium]